MDNQASNANEEQYDATIDFSKSKGTFVINGVYEFKGKKTEIRGDKIIVDGAVQAGRLKSLTINYVD